MKDYFSHKELRCKCGCGLYNFDPLLRDDINSIRKALGKELVVKSGCRCPAHNKKEGGSDTSDHLPGKGVDLKAISSRTRFIIISTAILLGITRIGFGKNFIHLGKRYDKDQRVFWDY